MPPTYLDSPPVRLKLGSKSSNKVSRLLPCEEISAYLSQIKRADERTRTAYPCSLRVIGHVLQGCAGGCKSRIPRRLSVLRFAACCTVLRSRWYQSGIKSTQISRRSLYVKPVVIYMLPTHRRTTLCIGLPGCNPIVGTPRSRGLPFGTMYAATY